MRQLRTYPLLVIIFMTIFALQSNGQDHKSENFDKALKKAVKSPNNKNNKEALQEAYIQLQSVHVQNLVTALTNGESLSKQSKKDLLEYLDNRKGFNKVYNDSPSIVNEDKLILLLNQIVYDYYDRGKSLIENERSEDYNKAKELLDLARSIDPNYKDINELYNKASENAKYNILIVYDLDNFQEYDQIMKQLFYDLARKIETYNTNKQIFHLNETAGQDYQLVFKLSYSFLEIGSILRKTNIREFERMVDGQQKRAKVYIDDLVGMNRAVGVLTIYNYLDDEIEEKIERHPFNFIFNTSVLNASINGDEEALNQYQLRDFQRMNGIEIDSVVKSEEEFKKRMLQFLDRHLRYDYSSSDLK